jgi:hypothetical protein
MWIAQGAAAGDVAMTNSGITTEDVLVQVVAMDLDVAGDTGDPANDPVKVGAAGLNDRTSEFTITANDTINNTGGTTTANQIVFVIWTDRSASVSETATA